MSNITVCCCDRYPGMHPCYKDCDRENDFVFLPTKEEKAIMKECTHGSEHDGVEAAIFDGVCCVCGTVVNEYEAIEASQREGGNPPEGSVRGVAVTSIIRKGE